MCFFSERRVSLRTVSGIPNDVTRGKMSIYLTPGAVTSLNDSSMVSTIRHLRLSLGPVSKTVMARRTPRARVPGNPKRTMWRTTFVRGVS